MLFGDRLNRKFNLKKVVAQSIGKAVSLFFKDAQRHDEPWVKTFVGHSTLLLTTGISKYQNLQVIIRIVSSNRFPSI